MKPPDYDLLPTLEGAPSGVAPNKLILSLLLFLFGAQSRTQQAGNSARSRLHFDLALFKGICTGTFDSFKEPGAAPKERPGINGGQDQIVLTEAQVEPFDRPF